MFRNLLMCNTREPPEYRYRPAWRARLAELKRLDSEGRAKLEAAQRIATLSDTSLLKHWWPECEEQAGTDKDAGTAPRRTDTGVAPPHDDRVHPHTLQRLTLMNLTVQRLGRWPGEVFALLCACLGVAPGFHKDQLHLEEYSAIRCMEAISNTSLQLLVHKKPLQIDTPKTEEESDACSSVCLTRVRSASEPLNHLGSVRTEMVHAPASAYVRPCCATSRRKPGSAGP